MICEYSICYLINPNFKIYVPIEDLGANWFAMVIGMHQEALYYLDSNPQPYLVRDRKARMRDVVRLLFIRSKITN